MRWLLRSPFHGVVDGQLMLVTIKGRISRRLLTLPVGYLELSDAIYALVTDPYSKLWWRNLDGGARVALMLRGKVVDAEATVLYTGFTPVLEQYCRRWRRTSRTLNVPVVDGVVDAPALQALAREVVMVRFRLA